MQVFIAGPRAIRSLNTEVTQELHKIVDQNITVLLGDANGVDKQLQKFFYGLNYTNVIIYASEGRARNNLGRWIVKNVSVPPNAKGFEYYAAKDLKMSEDANYGFMIWNGKSKGTLNNIINLAKQEKKVVIYFTPHSKFYSIRSLQTAEDILSFCDKETAILFQNLIESKEKVEQINFFQT